MLLGSQDGASSSEDTAELVRRHMSAAMPSRAETVRREVQLALRTREDGPSSTIRVSLFMARTLNATSQSRVTLSLR